MEGFAVASPDLFATLPELRQIDDLLAHGLIGTHHQPEFWRDWFAAQGVEARPEQRHSFDNLQLVYEAAAAGLGIALGLAPAVAFIISERPSIADNPAYGYLLFPPEESGYDLATRFPAITT